MDLKHLSESLAVRESHLPNSRFDSVNMAASSFTKIAMPGTQFREADLSELRISRCNLTKVAISACKIDGMTIDGISVADLQARAKLAGSERGCVGVSASSSEWP